MSTRSLIFVLNVSVSLLAKMLTFKIFKTVLFVCWLLSAGMSQDISRKDELFNKLVDVFEERQWLFSKCTAASDGAYIVQVLLVFYTDFISLSTF